MNKKSTFLSILSKYISLNFIEIGARGNVKDFKKFESIINYYGFEPDLSAFDKKHKLLSSIPFASINLFPEGLCTKLQSKNSNISLYLTKHEGCSSLLEPNFNLLDEYRGFRVGDPTRPFNENFHIKKQVPIKAKEVDLFCINGIESSDIIQIDIQGLEIDILSESKLIDSCTLVDIELEILELYNNQKLLSEALDFFESKGFKLIRLFNQGYAPRLPLSKYNFSDHGEIISTDAIFVKYPTEKFDEIIKFSLIVYFYSFYSLSLYYLNKLDNTNLSEEQNRLVEMFKSHIYKSYRKHNLIGAFYLRIKLTINKIWFLLNRCLK